MHAFKHLLTALLLCSLCIIPYTASATDTNADYRGYVWRIDTAAGNEAELPHNFRTAGSPFQTRTDAAKFGVDPNYIPSREGLDTLPLSGSAEFSVPAFHALLKDLHTRAQGSICVIDLRQESHGFMNGYAVSWYGKHDWGNIGRTKREALRDENMRIRSAQGKDVVLAHLDKKKQPKNQQTVHVTAAMTERELVENAGVRYVRLAVTDHKWADPQTIDEFVDLVKKMPADTWMHFHCQAGKGRTTSFMAMYDMMKNPAVPLKDILYRQYLLGGAYLAYDPTTQHAPTGWEDADYHHKSEMIAKFYDYVQQNHENDYAVPWSMWLKKNP